MYETLLDHGLWSLHVFRGVVSAEMAEEIPHHNKGAASNYCSSCSVGQGLVAIGRC